MSKQKVSSPPTAGSPKKSSSAVVRSPSKGGSRNAFNSTAGSVASFSRIEDDPDGTMPDFIYGGPFIKLKKPSPFLETATPINVQLQGTFKKSYAYRSLTEKMPIILTKLNDYLSKEGNKIKSQYQAADTDLSLVTREVTKLKNDLVSNKRYEKFTVDTEEAEKWNEWMDNQDQPKYLTNTWLWTESFIYRKIREACELTKGLQNFDPFGEQKQTLFADSMEPMCIVAEKVIPMLGQSAKDQKKNDFITLLKLSLWATKCDLSLSAGEPVTLSGPETVQEKPAAGADKATAGKSATNVPEVTRQLTDPLQMILDFKDKLLVDDSAKVYDNLNTKAENMKKAIAGNTAFKQQCSCHRLATLFGVPKCPQEAEPATEETAEGEAQEPPKPVPCPAKITIPSAVTFDIVCGNAGYELFTDLCLATFIIEQKIVQRIRFHVKQYPWYVSGATSRDYKYVIDSCRNSSFNREIPAEPKPAPAEGEAPPPSDPPRIISSAALKQLGDMWAQYLENDTFIICSDPYWTYPHVYKDMKKYGYSMYRTLQLAVAVLFKGDLNYRRLVGERNCNPVVGFDPSLQGFNPAPVIAVRTIQSDLVCGLPKGKWEALNKVDEKWMEKGDYGVIQLSPKAEALKVSDRPCADYGETCYGVKCPLHPEL